MMHLLLRTIFLSVSATALTACASIVPCHPQAPAPAIVENGLGSTLDALLATEHADGTFDGVALVSRSGQTVLRKGYGCADRKTAVAVGATTISDIGSVAKTFTAAAILHLEAHGTLDTGDALARFYPDIPDDKRDITLRQLLTHTSGLDDFHADSDFEPMTRAEAERRIFALEMKFPPGSGEAYSNAGYTLLAAIVERATGEPFRDYLRRALLQPAGLSDTGWYGDPGIDSSRLARGYGNQAPGTTTFERDSTWALVGAGGMVSTVDDLHAWHRTLSHGMLPMRQASRVFPPFGNGRWSEGSWRTLEIGGQTVVDMGGSTDFGYTSKVMHVPGADTVVVLLLNAHSDKYGAGTHHALGNRVLLPAIGQASMEGVAGD